MFPPFLYLDFQVQSSTETPTTFSFFSFDICIFFFFYVKPLAVRSFHRVNSPISKLFLGKVKKKNHCLYITNYPIAFVCLAFTNEFLAFCCTV